MGRFRRANQLSHKAVATHLGVCVAWVQDWEIPSRRRNPTKKLGKNNLNIYLNRLMIKAWDQVGIVTYVESGYS
ncbi:MAG: hypothetical protein KME05_23340 [Gloeocapsa sp. UFS-A4-WI-NPMV-4B04]|nr:hypothetical protein [Gloeocapsa sp. UFS-A4-WI-NPMV-4B04]